MSTPDERILDKIRDLSENRNYDRTTVENIATEMEDILGSAEMWNTLRSGFSTDELLCNLEYIAKECDI